MNTEEQSTLKAAIKADPKYANRLFSFDAIGDDLENRAINLVAHCASGQSRQSKQNQETAGIQALAKEALGRELSSNEIIVRAIELPKGASSVVRG